MVLALAATLAPLPSRAAGLLDPADSRHHVDKFNANDDEPYRGTYPNAAAWEFQEANVPRLSCPDMERTYASCWWAYRKHVRRTPHDGTLVTDLLPDVPWAGPENAISCAAALHLRDGRWLRDRSIADGAFWLRHGAAAWDVDRARGGREWVVSLLPDLIRNYRGWEHDRRDGSGLFWQLDDRDGMEVAASGHGYRPTLNRYLYGDARAVAAIARLAADVGTARAFDADADRIRRMVQERLWSDRTHSFHPQPRPGLPTRLRPEQAAVDPWARELIGYLPWLDDLPERNRGHEAAWSQLTRQGRRRADARRPHRGKDHNRSTYADLVMTGLCGLVPRADDTVEVDPLLPAGTWDWFCLDGVPHHGHRVAIAWNRDGPHVGRGAGLTVWVNDRVVARADGLKRMTGPL